MKRLNGLRGNQIRGRVMSQIQKFVELSFFRSMSIVIIALIEELYNDSEN